MSCSYSLFSSIGMKSLIKSIVKLLSNVYFAIQLGRVACLGSEVEEIEVRSYMDLQFIPINISYLSQWHVMEY